MDKLTPLRQQGIQLSQDNTASADSSSHRRASSQHNILFNSNNNAPIPRDNISSYAKRLELRNAGFRAALLPARRLSPPQASIGSLIATRVEGNDNAPIYVKTRDSSSSDTSSPLNILREISNSSRRKTASTISYTEAIEFADDEKDGIGQDCTDTMLFKSGSARSAKSKKRVRRVPSFQSTKYIEYLENELGVANEKLESLQSPETVKGQAARIRKLEKKIQELSQHLTDWEQNYEERVNDQVFERLHGESDLRLKILTLEEAAAHKEAHLAELGKELEDTKLKLNESESVESILSKRVDTLTELLAKSPTRKSFSLSLDTVAPPKTTGIIRLSASPTRDLHRTHTLHEVLQEKGGNQSLHNESGIPKYQDDEAVVETDTELIGSDTFSRPVSGIFSSRSSQTSSSRPTSMFSTGSFSISSISDDRPVSRPRRSRRFAPGSTSLKPLLLPTTAGFSQSFETPKKEQRDVEYSNSSSWESSDDAPTSTPSRPSIRRPYSWAHNAVVSTQDSIVETDESGDDTFVGKQNLVDELPAYLRHLATQHDLRPEDSEQSDTSSPSAHPRLSLQQELAVMDSFSGFSDQLDHCEGSPCVRDGNQTLNGSTFPTLRQRPKILSTVSAETEDSFMSNFSDVIARSDGYSTSSQTRITRSLSPHTLLPEPLRKSYLANLVASLRQKPFNLARQVLIHSWTRGSAQFGGFAWWVLSLVFRQRRHDSSTISATIPPKTSSVKESHSSPTGRSKTDGTLTPGSSSNTTLAGFAGMLPRLHNLVLSNEGTRYRCPHCVEPSRRRQFRLWTKLAIAIVVAIGYAMLEGPAAVLEAKDDKNMPQHGLEAEREEEL